METRKTILAVDDDAGQLETFKEILVPQYDFRGVKAASEALNFMNANKIDLILLDIGMPNISGFEFLSDIRKIPSYIAVPVIIVSGMSGEDFFQQAKNSSAAAVLSKPVTSNTLIHTIEKTLADAN